MPDSSLPPRRQKANFVGELMKKKYYHSKNCIYYINYGQYNKRNCLLT